MRVRIFSLFAVLLFVGGLSVGFAQQQQPPKAKTDYGASATTRVKTSKEVTPSWTYKGHWYGFITCNRLQRQLHQVKPDEVKKCVADGGEYIFLGPGRLDLKPQDKAAAFAGQEVYVTGTQTSATYGTGPTSDQTISGLYAGGDRPATRFETINIISIAPHARDDAMAKYAANDAAEISSRVSEKSQK